jgi:hypothetical protein
MIYRMRDTPNNLTETLKEHPDTMGITDKFIAVWHSGLQSLILVPGYFYNVSDEFAKSVLNENLKALHAETIS